MERDVVLVVVGGLVGLSSSLITLLFVYVLEGMRLRRQWAREDELRLRQQRTQLQDLLAAAGPEGRAERVPTPAERPEAE